MAPLIYFFAIFPSLSSRDGTRIAHPGLSSGDPSTGACNTVVSTLEWVSRLPQPQDQILLYSRLSPVCCVSQRVVFVKIIFTLLIPTVYLLDGAKCMQGCSRQKSKRVSPASHTQPLCLCTMGYGYKQGRLRPTVIRTVTGRRQHPLKS